MLFSVHWDISIRQESEMHQSTKTYNRWQSIHNGEQQFQNE